MGRLSLGSAGAEFVPLNFHAGNGAQFKKVSAFLIAFYMHLQIKALTSGLVLFTLMKTLNELKGVALNSWINLIGLNTKFFFANNIS